MYKFYKFSINTTIVLLKKKICKGLLIILFYFLNYQLSKYIQGRRWKQKGLGRRRPRWIEVKGIEFLGSLGSWYCYWVFSFFFFFFFFVFCILLGLFMWGIMVNGYLFNYTLNWIYNDGHGYLMLSALFYVNCMDSVAKVRYFLVMFILVVLVRNNG